MVARMPQSRYRARGLPHLDAPGHFQHIAFHLADSLPSEALARMERELGQLPPSRRRRERAHRIAALLDAGMGSCLLSLPPCAPIMVETLLYGDGVRYSLQEWVVMPNHIHVLIRQYEGHSLAKIVQSWKRHSAREIRRTGADIRRHAGSARASVWQRDYWDRYIRDEHHLAAVKRYIRQNPVAAGLVSKEKDWPYSSAGWGGHQS